MNIAVSGHKIWVRLCNAIGAPELATHADYATAALRSQNRDLLHAELEAHLRHRDTAEWVELLNEAGVPCGPIYSIDEAFSDPQVQPPRHRRQARRGRLPRPAGDAQPHAGARRRPSAGAGRAHRRGPARDRLRRRRDRAPARARESFEENRDAQRQDDLAQGRRRRLDDLQQPRAPQRDLARDVGGGARDHGRLRRRPVGARDGRHRRRRQGVRLGRRHLEVQGRAPGSRGRRPLPGDDAEGLLCASRAWRSRRSR